MQTFLPVKSFVRSAEFLDIKRLGKQRIEAVQILEILLNKPLFSKNQQSVVPFNRSWGGWVNHPAVLMWKGHEEWLKLYLACIVGEWLFRGYNNNIVVPDHDAHSQMPPRWLGFEPFHKSHRSNLIRKNPIIYAPYWPDEDRDLLYFWPTHEGFDVMDSDKTLIRKEVAQNQGDNKNMPKDIIAINVTPEMLKESLPVDFPEYSGGFSDQTLELNNIEFEVSYDGESELLAKVIKKPADITVETAEQELRDLFATVDDADETEDEDEDE